MPTVTPWSGNVQFPGGTKAKNDAYTGATRTLSIDTESKGIRVHDGVTPGGTPIAVKTTGLMSWDGSVVSDLGTAVEATSVNYSCKAYTVKIDGVVSYSITAGALPPGLNLNSNGTITGILPNILTGASYNFTVTATDGTSSIAKAFTLTVSATNNAPTWNTSSGLGTITGAISVQLSATDPEGQNLTYALVSGTLPTGVSISSTGLLSGPNPNDGGTYNFTAGVTDGTNLVNRSFTMTFPVPTGESVYTTPGTYSWTCPTGVTSVCAVAVGAGANASETGSSAFNGSWAYSGGGGGALAYANNIAVTPGQSYTIVVGAGSAGTGRWGISGGDSSFSTFVKAGGGKSGSTYVNCVGGTVITGTGGAGGAGGSGSGSGAGGAGGYSGAGGKGGNGSADGGFSITAGASGSGGGGGGGGGCSNMTSGGNGGSVGLYGQGTSGAGGTAGGSTGGAGGNGSNGGYGAGGVTIGAPGAVRIIWGSGRSFPSNAA